MNIKEAIMNYHLDTQNEKDSYSLMIDILSEMVINYIDTLKNKRDKNSPNYVLQYINYISDLEHAEISDRELTSQLLATDDYRMIA
jgi:hypothetical protein